MMRIVVLAGALVLVVTRAALGQAPPPDTAQAIAALEARLAANPDDAEAHYRLGLLLQASGGNGAGGHLERATELAPDSAHYWLALAGHQRRATLVIERARVGGLLDRAVVAATRTGGPRLAEALYQRAREDWRRYEHRAHRYLMQGEATQVDLVGFMEDWRNVEIFFERFARPDPGSGATVLLGEIADELDRALAAGPAHLEAAGLRVVAALEREAPEEALAVARRAAAAAAEHGETWALVGLALARLNRWDEAEAAFDTALARMPAALRARYHDIRPILKPTDSVRVAEADAPARQAFATVYWGLAQPSYLRPYNEIRTEYYARLTYADARGWDDERRSIYLRYGPPDIEASVGTGRISEEDAVGILESQRNTIIWAYTWFQLRFIFTVAPGSNRATFAGNFGLFAQEARRVAPVRFDNVPAIRALDTALVQLAQFRGDEDRTTLAVFSFVPVGRMASEAAAGRAELRSGLVVRDLRLRDVYRNTGTETVALGDSVQVERRSWRLSLPPGEYVLRVEAELPAIDQAARSTTPLRIDPFPHDSLRMSTLVVAERVSPRDSQPDRWTDYFIDPSIGRFRPGEPVGFLWEVYNLEPDSAGVVRYQVEVAISVKDVERPSVVARIIGGVLDAVGLTARGDEQLALTYQGEAALASGAEKPEHLMVDLGDASPAVYGVVLTVTDLVSGQTVSQRRQFIVTRPPASP